MEEQYYGYVYKIILIKTGDYYIGSKKSSNFIPTYLGSGVEWNNRIVKYHKIEDFNIEILCWCNSAKELAIKENEFIGNLIDIDSFSN